MEWRVIVPVLCLIGLLHVPGNAANSTNTTNNNSTTDFQFNIVFHINETFFETYSNMSNNATIELKTKITSEVAAVFRHLTNFQRFDILQFRNGSIVVDGNLHFNNSASKPIVANLTQILHNGNFSFTILTNFTRITEVTATAAPTAAPATTTTPATTVSRPAKIATFNVVFRILQTFQDFHSNLSHPETKQLSDNITNAFFPFFKRRFANFFRMAIRGFSKGSIVADSILEFDNTNNTSPNMTAVKNTFEEAINTANFSISVDLTSINVTDITNAFTVSTTTPATTVSRPAKIATFNVVFRILQTFQDFHSNLSHPETKQLSDNITNAFFPFFKRRFANFFRMAIRGFSKGSIVADSILEFDNTNNTSPNMTAVKNTFEEAINTANFSISVDLTSINVTDITNAFTVSTTTPATTVSRPAKIATFNVVFRILQTFQDFHSNLSHPETKQLSDNITNAFFPFFKRRFANFFRMAIRGFSKGSIVADSILEFDNTNNTSPNMTAVKNTFEEAINTANFSISVDLTSINVTDITNVSTTTQAANNRSPVLASMLMALWMTLASLLVSAVMH